MKIWIHVNEDNDQSAIAEEVEAGRAMELLYAWRHAEEARRRLRVKATDEHGRTIFNEGE